jgi:hypothetical protein
VLRRLIRLVWRSAVVAAVVWAGRRALIRWIDGPGGEPSRAPWPDLDYGASEAQPAATTAPAATTQPEPAATSPAATPATPATRAAPATGDTPWLPPDESGECPQSHQVKAKLSSRIFRLPGMSTYERTVPDRCYLSAEAAEADGFTQAKR